MRIPKEIAEDIFLDEEAETIAVCVDRVSLMLDIKEFMSLAERLETARESLVNDGLVAVTISSEDAESNVVPFKQGYSFAEDDEFH